MKRMLVSVTALVAAAASITSYAMSAEEALSEFQRIIVPTEEAAGFHSLEIPKLRKFSKDVPIAADAECLRLAIVTEARDKPICRRHDEIQKIVIVPLRDDWYRKAYPGDYQVMVHYKGLGKLIVLSLSAGDVDPFIDAVRVLSPMLKKVKDKR